ncbi:MAG TPA: ATP-dependent DNA helicase [Marmoricola sp.]|nr:ATP-dependent DNA helicase [Marmoricola sp.]
MEIYGAETSATRYRLRRSASAVSVPVLDADQQRVVDHEGGPLLVLAGPGTGKTTTLAEAITDRIVERDAPVDSVLALTFGRKAAEQLRDRVTARVGRTTSTALSMTFHSFAYGLVRRYSPADLYVAPLRLLSASEQDVVLRELLEEHPESVRWPAGFRRALGTRGFAREVHDVLARAREKGLDPADLEALGEGNDVPEFVAAGWFMEQYLTNLDHQGATDYADLIRRAALEAEVHRDELRSRFQHVFVDEYQDTDPAQVGLLQAIAGDGANLTVVGDPHQAIYGFRGADVRGILEFPSQFRTSSGEEAPLIALRTTRRFGPTVLDAAQKVAQGLPWGPLGARARESLSGPQPAEGVVSQPVEVYTFDTDRAEAEHIADLLRRAHLQGGVAWDDMAVLVRSGRGQLPALRRALGAAGVPVETASDEIPLALDPGVAPLLEALRAVVNLDNDRPDDVDYIDPVRAQSLLTGPLCGLDATGVRRLSRQLRGRERQQGGTGRTSPELVREAVVKAGFVEGLDSDEAVEAHRLNALLHQAAAMVSGGVSAEEVLWHLWARTGWAARLRRQAEHGGAAGRRAHRDLDAIVALFELAARSVEQRDHSGVRNFVETLAAQRIPSDSLAERGVRGASVRMLTAHRSKGLQWKLVVVAHVQEAAWPDLRRRATLLRADRIGMDGLVPPVTTREQLIDERRLFYVACTRAEQRLVVTAVSSGDDDGEQPSRFLEELGVEVVHQQGRPARALSMVGVVAELRRTAGDPDAPVELREAAARRLARLASLKDPQFQDRALVPEAHPSRWWGLQDWTMAPLPIRPADEPLRMSASTLSALMACPAQWFFTREAGGQAAAHQSATLGNLVHKVAEEVAARGSTPPSIDELMERVDQVWGRLEFRTHWSRDRERMRIRFALQRFLDWHAANPRTLAGAEQSFNVTVDVGEGVMVHLVGTADRLELDTEGRVVVVDFKTGRNRPSGPEVQRNEQLALYQYAIDAGAVASIGTRSGGAELVQLGSLDPSEKAVVQAQSLHTEETPERLVLLDNIRRAEQIVRSEEFNATPGKQCDFCDFVSICPAKGAPAVMRS